MRQSSNANDIVIRYYWLKKKGGRYLLCARIIIVWVTERIIRIECDNIDNIKIILPIYNETNRLTVTAEHHK